MALTVPDSIVFDDTPELIDTYGTGSTAYELIVKDNIAYVITANNPGYLETFDVSDPENIVFLDQINTYLYYSYGMCIDGDYAYVTAYNNNRLVIFDISDPSNLLYVSYISANLGGPFDVKVLGGYAYVASRNNNSLVIFDVNDPANPIFSGSSSDGLVAPENLQVNSSGTTAYISSKGNNKLVIFNTVDKNNPVKVGEISTGLNYPQELFVESGYAYITSRNNSTLVIYDISDAANPAFIADITEGLAAPSSIDIQGNYAFIGNSSGGYTIVNISDPTDPQLALDYNTSALYDIVGSEEYVYFLYGSSLQIHKVSNSSFPTIGPDGSLNWTSMENYQLWEVNDATNEIYYNNGYVGINTNNPTERLDVNGEARIRSIYSDNSLDDVLVRDPDGVIYRRDASTLADNLGNHTATQNIDLNGNLLTGNGGIDINIASGDGFYINSAVNKGIRVYSSGDPSTHYPAYSPLNNGIEVNGAEGHGLYIGQADLDGVCVFKAGNPQDYNTNAWGNGFEVAGSEGHGLWVGWAGQSGVSVGESIYTGISIGHAGGQGVSVYRAGTPSNYWDTYNSDGFNVAGAEGNGLYVGHSDLDGVIVRSANGNLFQGGADGSEVYTVSNTGDVTATSFSGDGSNLTGISGDNLGNHTATQNIDLNGNLLTGDGGIDLGYAINDGINIYSAGNPSTTQFSVHKNGFEVEGAEGSGLFVGRADNDGVLIYDAGDDGVSVVTAADNLFQGGGNGNEVFTVSNTGDVTATSFTGVGSGLTNVPGDNLGNHTATQNIVLGSNWLSGDGGNEGLSVSSSGRVGIGISSPNETLEIGGDGRVFIGDGGGVNRSGLLIDGNETTDHIRLQSYGYGTSPDIDMKINPGGGNVIINEASGSVGIGTSSPGSYKLYCNGSAAKPGGGSWTDPSDKRLKDIHGNYTRGLNEILQLNPISYNYKPGNELDLPNNEEYIGLIAQEVEKLIPEAVEKMESGYLAVNNDPIIWAMLNAIKEQNNEMISIKSENQELKTQLEDLVKRLEILENK